MWAHDRNGEYQHPGDKWWVEIHGLPDPACRSSSPKSPRTRQTGRLGLDRRSKQPAPPCMIWASRAAFDVQFPYGPAAEEERGKGRVVRLRITAREDG